jgi:uncharacterized PurR-regulated membrane protein YhhQ (DUF165 family)
MKVDMYLVLNWCITLVCIIISIVIGAKLVQAGINEAIIAMIVVILIFIINDIMKERNKHGFKK